MWGILAICGVLRLILVFASMEEGPAANQLKSYLREAEAGTVGGRKVTWKQVNRSTVDAKKLQSEKPEIYRDYLKQSSYRRLSVA